MSDICLDLRSECDFHGVAIDDLRVEIHGSLKFENWISGFSFHSSVISLVYYEVINGEEGFPTIKTRSSRIKSV